jgi:alcohol dehydrogenase class IV
VPLRESFYHPHRMGECKIEYGIGRVDLLAQELDYLDKSRALVLYGPNAAKGATLPRVRDALGPHLKAEFGECRIHAPVDVSARVADIVLSEDIDVIVTIGGGSTSDTAKGVVCMLGEGKPLEELASQFTLPDTYVENYMKKPKIPIIAVATMLGGAEVAPGFGALDGNGRKLVYRGDYVTARVVILDPVATLDVDLDAFKASCFNGLAHGMEGLYSRSRTPITDGLCKQAISLFTRNMERLADDATDLNARMSLLWASALGGLIVTNARVGIQHGMAHSIGATLMLSHGLANAITLVPGVEFNMDVAAPQLAAAARAMGVGTDKASDEENARLGLERIQFLKNKLGIPDRLGSLPEARRLGLDATRNGVVSQLSRNRATLFNPKMFSADDVAQLITVMW